jgi:hypothetical protein
MNTKDINELKSESDRDEELYQQAQKTRRAAVADSQVAAKATARARMRYMRSLEYKRKGRRRR